MDKLKIFSNTDNTRFIIGWNDKEISMCSDMSLIERFNKLDNEIELIKINEGLGAKVEYYDYRKDKEVTKEDYLKHFENYNSDECFILSTSIYNTREQAEKAKEFLKQFI